MRLREQGSSDEEIAKRLRFKSVEEMRARLHGWELPDWLVGGKTNSGKKRVHQKSTPRRLRSFGPPKELPPAGNATELFKERLEALLESGELLKHIDEGLYGRYFLHAKVETAPVFWPRERYSKEEWDKLCEQYDLDPGDNGFWDTNVLIRLPGGAALSPSEMEATLIGVYALAGGRMDLLLEALHPDSSNAGFETWEEIRQYVEGSRAGDDKRDGLKVLARQLAIWVRGSEVRPAGRRDYPQRTTA